MKKSLLSLSLFLLLTAGNAPAQGVKQIGGAPKSVTSGVIGSVIIGPVDRKEGKEKYQSHQTTLVVNLEDGKEVTRFNTMKDGKFRVQLDPGTYTIAPLPDETLSPECDPVTVTVEQDKFVKVTVNCDLGLEK
jgi:hypothetical protein